MLNLATLLEESARSFPDRLALVQGETQFSYATLNQRANQVANLLITRGVQPGERVALACPNIWEFPAIYYGALKAGAVVVPLNTLLKAGEFEYYLQDSQAVLFFCFEGGNGLTLGEEAHRAFDTAEQCRDFIIIGDSLPLAGDRFSQVISTQPTDFDSATTLESDTAVILYTSGTTGRAKGAELTHANLVLNALGSVQLFNSSVEQPDRHLVTLPLFHTFGSTVQMNAGFALAATLVLVPRFDAKQAIALMQKHAITFFAGVPTMYWALLNALDDTADLVLLRKNLRMAVSGGASLPVQIIEDFAQRFGVNILEGYGLSETSPVATFNHPGRVNKVGSIGQPIWGIEVRLVDVTGKTLTEIDQVGEIAVRGHNVMKGYLNRPEATAEVLEKGWFRTGDLARRDADGFYFIVDRSKDVIIRGGFNVYPREVEELMIRHPAVSLVAVIGVPHPSLGEEIKAVVVLKDVDETVTEEQLITWTKERLAAFKYPRIVEFVERLPMTSTGKVMKRLLR
ncbi:Long-chain-fatty-acid--CoA ligase [Serratia proteamaculans]|uniref:long-chain-fatty-acid--CoA ligase n=1 Tax=Serratia proteamaculans TaxID=28151 RepID=UPI00217A43A5|nr:long-chain fatty acid--CoA ligase [Serratia proteamaculans]CAI0892563.1 Long-chain-fatty-acid--CoA ligase [Serratia proteamaculans]CAI1786106.1 Long-chain-fatty-acid--CoA ligase [Serratia proteamaculans]